uniref:Atrial natriuretic peptide clearance receptor n=1 Tax=Magallana gigas TaxID=29159 RepID=K1PRH8_MAGGI
MAGYWNYPILTPVGTDDELGNKNDFRTLTRLAFNYEHLDITVIYDVMGKRQIPSRNFNRLIGENLHKEFEKAGLTCTLLKFVSDSRRDYLDVLTAANRTSRVFAISGDSVALRQLMIVAHSLGMLEGDYVFIYFESFRGNGNGNIHWKRGDQYDEIVRKAYESMMVVSLFKPSSSQFKTFESRVKGRSMELYNFSFDALQYEVSPYVTAFYDAFTVYGQVLKETIEADQDYNDANEINQRMWNRTFDGVGGYLRINSNGDREMDMIKMKKESEIHSNWWRITWDDLTWIAYANSEASSLGCSLAKAEHIL